MLKFYGKAVAPIIMLTLVLICSSQVDPIVASFSGGAVGVISALMLLEINNVEQQEKKRCKYCHGTGIYWQITGYITYLTNISTFEKSIDLYYSYFIIFCILWVLWSNPFSWLMSYVTVHLFIYFWIGYLSCARCSSSGLCVSIEPIVTSATDRPLNAPTTRRCQNCSGSGKVSDYVNFQCMQLISDPGYCLCSWFCLCSCTSFSLL